MRRKRVFGPQALSIVIAAGAGYFLGTWGASAVRNSELSPIQTVALRFPREWHEVRAHETAPAREAATGAVSPASRMGVSAGWIALFDPEPIARQTATPDRAIKFAKAEAAERASTPDVPPEQFGLVRPIRRPDAVQEGGLMKAVGTAAQGATIAHRLVDRRRFTLDDAQIARIKRRLHLTYDQERLWPPVEIALRKIALVRARQSRRPAATAAIDPNSAAVQDLRYAAIPLLMSFSDQQKDEVRSLVHGMGLDQLASQF